MYHQIAAVTIEEVDRLVTESRAHTTMFVNGSLVSLNVIFVAGNRENRYCDIARDEQACRRSPSARSVCDQTS